MIKPFQKNDRVVFLGDSITHNNHQIMYIFSYYKKHFPNLNVSFFNSGIAGASLSVGFEFYDRDFSKWNGNVVVLMYGMNDSSRDVLSEENEEIKNNKLTEAFELYKVNLDKMCKKLLNDGYRLIICTPTPYDEIHKSNEPFLKGGMDLINKYAAYVREYAQKNNIELVDYNLHFNKILNKVDNLIKQDHVHPTLEVGHIEMAKCFLASQGYNLDIKELSKDFLELDNLIQYLRDAFASESLFLPKDKTFEERLEFAKNIEVNLKDNIYIDYFKFLAKRYIEINGDFDSLRNKIENKIKEIYLVH